MDIYQELRKLKENYRGKNILLSLSSVANSFFSKHNIKISKDEIKTFLNLDDEFYLFPYDNLVWKESFYNFIKNIPEEKLKDFLTFEYFIEFSEKDIDDIKFFLKKEDSKEELKPLTFSKTEKDFNFEEIISIDNIALLDTGAIIDMDNSNNTDSLPEEIFSLNSNLDRETGEITQQLEYLMDGLSFLEPFLEMSEFWIEALRAIIGDKTKTSKEIFRSFPLFNKVKYRDKIEEILCNERYFMSVDLYRAYANSSNINYLPLTGTLSEKIADILKEFNPNQVAIYYNKILGNETLEKTGQKLGVTRERVRQIEIKLRERFSTRKVLLTLKPYFQYITDLFAHREQIFTLFEFEQYLNSKYEYFGELQFDIIAFFNEFYTDNRKIYKHYGEFISMLAFKDIEKIFEEIFKNQNFMDRENFICSLEHFGVYNVKFIDKFVEDNAKIEICKNFIFYQDSRITISDRIVMIFKITDRVLKISELVALYDEYFGEKLTEHNMNSKLLASPELFRRVFTGTYSLTEWGMEQHIMAKELVVDCLRAAARPLSNSEIIALVKPKTQANEGTIRMFIGNNDKTFSYDQGWTALKEWADDEIISQKYYISKNRIAANENSVVNYNYKGTFERAGNKINLHKVAPSYLEYTGSMDIGQTFLNEFNIDKFRIFTTEKEYPINLSYNKKYFNGIRKVLEDKNLKNGDYFYLENCGNGILKLYTWEEFENGAIKIPSSISETIDENEFMREEPEEISLKIYEPEKTYSENLLDTFDELLQFGLDKGYIEREWLMNLDYDNEKIVNDQFDAIEELESRDIKIM